MVGFSCCNPPLLADTARLRAARLALQRAGFSVARGVLVAVMDRKQAQATGYEPTVAQRCQLCELACADSEGEWIVPAADVMESTSSKAQAAFAARVGLSVEMHETREVHVGL